MIAIVDHAAGNLFSVERAFRRLGVSSKITGDPEEIRRADRIVIPGVGRAGSVMDHFKKTGLDQVIREMWRAGRPILGICIGIQVIFEHSQEDDVNCLGLLDGTVVRFPGSGKGGALKVPQMGWNAVRQTRPHSIFSGIPDESHFYFVNSYYPVPSDPTSVIGETSYGVTFASAVASGRLVATQFHLEKSGPLGLRMLENFCRWKDRDPC